MKKNSDIFVLLVGLILVSCSLGFIHRRIAANEDRDVFNKDAALTTIAPLMTSSSVDAIAQVLSRYPHSVIKEVLPTVLGEQSSLSEEDKVLLLVALTYYYENNVKIFSSEIFSWYVDYAQLVQKYSPFYFAARIPYCSLIGPLSSSLIAHGKKNIVEEWFKRALTMCIEKADPCSLDLLCGFFVPLFSAVFMTTLLDNVVSHNQGSKLAAALIMHGADVNYVDKTSGSLPKTVLMKAVENNNEKLVSLLLKNNASVSIVTDLSLGTALQIAFVKKYIAIEALLREHGATY